MIVSIANDIGHDRSSKSANDWCGFLLNQAAMHIRTATIAALSSLGITPPQLRVLEAISEAQPLSQVKLGEMVNMDRTTIVHVIDQFERLGLAARKAYPSDRRSHAIELTKEGHRILHAGRARARSAEDEFLAPLSHPERETLRKLLRKLSDPIPCPKEKVREPSPAPPNP